jgi:hypothetical protein
MTKNMMRGLALKRNRLIKVYLSVDDDDDDDDDHDDDGNTKSWLNQITIRCLPDEIKDIRKPLKRCRRFEQRPLEKVRSLTARPSWLHLDVEC